MHQLILAFAKSEMYTVIARIIIKRIAKKVYSENESIKTLNQSERNGVRRKKETQNTWNK